MNLFQSTLHHLATQAQGEPPLYLHALYVFTKLTKQSQRTSSVMSCFCYSALEFIRILAKSQNWVLVAVFHCVNFSH